MPKNVYDDPLEAFTYQEMLDSLAGIGDETGRLELKREMIARSKIAHIACSMANADGGIIAIGIQEAAPPSTPFGVHGKLDIGDHVKVGLVSAINARLYPPIGLDIQGYESADGLTSFLVLRVSPSGIAPHEYTPSDETHNLPVRRGSATEHLRLAEIEALQARNRGGPTKSPLGDQRYRKVSLRRDGIEPDFIFGIQLWPESYRETRRVMDVDDDHLCYQINHETQGTNADLHEPLDEETMLDGIWFRTRVASTTDEFGHSPEPDQQLEIDSDGTITVRFKQNTKDWWSQLLTVLATGYVAAQEIYFAFGIAPRARARVLYYLRPGADGHTYPFPQNYEDNFTIDLASQPFSDAFLPTVMRMLRASNQNSQRVPVRNKILQAFIDNYLPIADELQRRWLS